MLPPCEKETVGGRSTNNLSASLEDAPGCNDCDLPLCAMRKYIEGMADKLSPDGVPHA